MLETRLRIAVGAETASSVSLSLELRHVKVLDAAVASESAHVDDLFEGNERVWKRIWDVWVFDFLFTIKLPYVLKPIYFPEQEIHGIFLN